MYLIKHCEDEMNKAFKYESYPLARDAVRVYLKGHMSTLRHSWEAPLDEKAVHNDKKIAPGCSMKAWKLCLLY